ncbi:MAG: DUF1684 domain-containing protein [Phaeodactylibacter sp.]|nr:DUF1684 domain-containing protein [Phaeodactylibacter sp.]MCB9264629.1 DUF1684 domain-containing protein [Lewinellaceae bacterium]MCB9287268.1 DUF1684 domain-containing protein [Lewinellaceae bacterium]
MVRQLALVLCFLAPAALLPAQNSQNYAREIRLHRRHYKKEFLKEERSPLDKKGVKKLRFFPPDESYRVICTFERTPEARPFDMATYSGITKPYVQYGTATFTLNGRQLQLGVYQSLRLREIPMYRDYLFIPFKDLSNGEATYGGGRYMDIRMDDIKNGELMLDFNKAYNPYCAYSDGYNCPVPPVENHLETEVNAGEKSFGGH